ncbi:MAG: (4Fe-4S)-binding protein [Chloroflexota bacterium]
MADRYTGIADDRRYTGENVDITYNLKRCIHAKACINRLSEVFDTKKRPWINADGAPADTVAKMIPDCPSGALHYERKDGGESEAIPTENTVVIWKNGPLQVSGDMSIQGATVAMDTETRVTLCRCGASNSKPFCDNSHIDDGFEAEEVTPETVTEAPSGGKLTITLHTNGPLEFDGNVSIMGVE